MDAEIAPLAGTAGTTIATPPATDTGNGVLSLWRRARPDDEERVAAQLDTSRRGLLDAQADGDEETGREIAAEWRGRIRPLLVAHPEPAVELSSLLTEPAPGTAAAATVTQHATASGGSRAHQVGRNLNVEQR
ncbi:hypothetical protein [Streptomyces sp. NPDC093707]|uniref:hypothetical protein n=1 Tax=Streptomyces sp. NPDC093707 TaxID=3154984 RepID=UPI003450D174